MKRVIIHIGTQKTGSTYIQNFFLKNNEKLLARNILFPNVAIPNIKKIEGRTSGHALLIKFLSKPNSDLIVELKSILTKVNPHTLILSSENYSLNPQIIPYFRKVFKAKEFKVIIYLRRQDHFLESMYKERIVGGWHQETIPIEEFIQLEHGDINTFVPDYNKLLSPWAEEFGIENIIVRPFEVDKWYMQNLVRDFFKACKLKWSKEYGIDNIFANKSISADLTEYVRYINKIKLPTEKHRQFILENNTLFLEAFKQVEKPGVQYLTKKQREIIIAKYRYINEFVAEKYLKSTDLFDRTIEDFDTIAKEKLTDIPMLIELLTSAINLKSQAIYESIEGNVKMNELVRLDAIKNKSTIEHLKWELGEAIKEIEQSNSLREQIRDINTDLNSKLSLQDILTSTLKTEVFRLEQTSIQRNDVINTLYNSTSLLETQFLDFVNESRGVSTKLKELNLFSNKLSSSIEELLQKNDSNKYSLDNIRIELIKRVSEIISQITDLEQGQKNTISKLKKLDIDLNSKLSESIKLLNSRIKKITHHLYEFQNETKVFLNKEINDLKSRDEFILNEISEVTESLSIRFENVRIKTFKFEELTKSSLSKQTFEIVKLSEKLYLEISSNVSNTLDLKSKLKAHQLKSEEQLHDQSKSLASFSIETNSSLDLMKSEIIQTNESINNRIDGLIVKNIENEGSVRIVDSKNDELKYTLDTIFRLNYQRSYHSILKSIKRIFTLNFRSQLSILRKSKMINPLHYYSQIPELKYKSISCEKHYLNQGVMLGINPNNEFNTKRYLHENPDIIYTGINPLVHYYLKKY